MTWAERKRRIEVLEGRSLAYVEEGTGDPIVLLHGNPTSSYLWREVLGHLSPLGRCVAPDLIGMGDSDRLPRAGPGSYRFADHRRHLDVLLDLLAQDGPLTLVVHDWGSALGFDWANRHRDAVRGIAYMEAIVTPLTWEEWPPPARAIFEAMRSPAGEGLILERNLFIERILPSAVLRELSAKDLDEYRRPFLAGGESRRPMLSWPREIPIDGEPADVAAIVADYADWLSSSDVPKLFVNAEPGNILIGRQRDFCRSWPNQTEVTVPGLHFVQEDSAEAIGRAIAAWRAAI